MSACVCSVILCQAAGVTCSRHAQQAASRLVFSTCICIDLPPNKVRGLALPRHMASKERQSCILGTNGETSLKMIDWICTVHLLFGLAVFFL